MAPRYQYGLIVGIIVAVLNICGGAAVGYFACCLTVLVATIAGYLASTKEAPGKGVAAGATAAAIAAAIGLVGQIIGASIGIAVTPMIFSSLNTQLPGFADAYRDTGTIAGAIGLNFCFGLFGIALSAGIGALTGYLAGPKVPPAFPPYNPPPTYNPPA